MIGDLIKWVFIAVFVLKLIGNISLPYRVLRSKPKQGISIGFALLGDLLLLIVLTSLSWIHGRVDVLNSHAKVAIGVIALVLVSYAHYFIVLLMNSGIGVSKKKK